jgi:Family of unknown function (DUF6152)
MNSKRVGTAFLIAFTAFCILVGAAPALAHHSFSAEFDAKKPISIEGVIAKVDWINPHSWLHVDVTNKNGEIEHWDIQTESPFALRKAGMTREAFGKPGDKVKIQAFGAKDGTKHLAIVRSISYENGTTFELLGSLCRTDCK